LAAAKQHAKTELDIFLEVLLSHRLTLWVWCLLALELAVPSASVAEDKKHERLILPVVVNPHLQAGTLTNQSHLLEQALAAQRARHLDLVDAITRLHQRVSRRTSEFKPEDMTTLQRCAEDALDHVANGRRAATERTVTSCLDYAKERIDRLSQNEDLARKINDVCLYLVRDLHHANQLKAAETQAAECLRLVPKGVFSDGLHPPWIRDVYTKVKTEYEKDRTPSLKIRTNENNCKVRLNGRIIGHTPFDLSAYPHGMYLVQLECAQGRTSRVHRAEATPQGPTLAIDMRFDRALRSEEQVELVFAQTSDAQRHAFSDAVRLGAAMALQEVWLLTREADKSLRIDVIAIDKVAKNSKVVNSAWIPESGLETLNPYEVAATALLKHTSIDLRTGATGSKVETTTGNYNVTSFLPTVEGRAGNDTKRPKWWPWLLAGTGAAGLGAGWLLYSVRALDDSYNYGDSMKLYTWLPAGVGAAALTTSLVWLLPEEDGIPWWSWVSGGVGLGLVAWGITQVAHHNDRRSCEPTSTNSCAEFVVGDVPGGLLWITSVPLLSVPIIYGVRSLMNDKSDKHTSFSVSVMPSAAQVFWSGAF